MQIERSSTQTHHRRRRSELRLYGDGVQLSQLKHEPSGGIAGAHFGSVIPSGADRSRSERSRVEGPSVRMRRRKVGPPLADPSAKRNLVARNESQRDYSYLRASAGKIRA